MPLNENLTMLDDAITGGAEVNLTEKYWFAMSAPYCKELEAKQFLDRLGIENFVPMQWQVVAHKNGKKSRELVPAIHNLIFARTTRPIIQEVKTGIKFLQYRTQPENGKNVPIIVPDVEMYRFIAVTDTCDKELVFIRPEEIDLRKGTRVRVHGGLFDGVEGVFVKVAGRRNRRVVVSIDHVIAVTAEISPDLIEILP